MQYSKLKKYRLTTPLGNKIGKLTDLIINTKNWTIPSIIVTCNPLLDNIIEYDTIDIKLDHPRIKMIIDGESYPSTKVLSLEHMTSKALMKRKVFSDENKKVGKIYDIIIDTNTESKIWKVEKLLVSDISSKRRKRISPINIESIADKIVVRLL